MGVRSKARQEDGFTIAEIMVAGLILVLALIPMARMFDTSFKGIRVFERSQRSMSCARVALEEIQAMPFYKPHTVLDTEEEVFWDIDDRFWGDRNPINDNPEDPAEEGVPHWERIPEVQFYGYGEFEEFPDFRVGVQLAYLDDDLGVAEMHDAWGPKESGLDRPTNSDNNTLHMVLVRLTVYWADTAGGEDKSLALESIISDTQAVYNFGSTRVTVDPVLNPDFVLNPDRPNAAAHWPPVTGGVKVIIEGWGFEPDTVEVHLVRYKYHDLEVTLTYKSEDLLMGYVNLAEGVPGSPDPGEPDWEGRAAVGYWSVKTRQEDLFSSYLYNGLIVEYPKPNVERFGNAPGMDDRMGSNNQTDALIRVEGGPFVNLIDLPAVRLIMEDEDGVELDMLTGVVEEVEVPASSHGYAETGCALTARFDFSTATAGEYYLQVVNTREPTLVGHRASDYHADTYIIQEYRPVVDGITVDATGGQTTYRNRLNPWAVTISGSHFNMVGSPPVAIYLCSEVEDELPAGDWVQGTVASVAGSSTIKGSFDVSTLPVGDYVVYVRNLVNNLAGWTDGAPLRVEMMEGIDSFTPASGHAFYENYYDIPATIDGWGLSGTTAITISNGSVAYEVDEYTVVDNGRISIPRLNLINCPNGGGWVVRVAVNGGESVHEAPFAVALGPAVILPPHDSKHAIRIYRHGGWFGSGWDTETTAKPAEAVASFAGNNATARFEVQGMGFPISGSTTLRVWGEGLSREANCTTSMDRDSKTVKITSADWSMPTLVSEDYGISVQRVGSPTVDSYQGRWRLVKIE